MERVEENEQWKLQGDCTKCRRNNYCSKPCTHCNRRKRAEFKKLVTETMIEMVGRAMNTTDKSFL